MPTMTGSAGGPIERPATLSRRLLGERPADWVDRDGWTIDVSRIKELRHRADDETVFLFGVVENEDELLHLFAGGPLP